MNRDARTDSDVEHGGVRAHSDVGQPWALVPVKRFDQGKSRLGEALSPEARADLARSMFDRVVGSVLGSLVKEGVLGGVLVITDGPDVAERALHFGAHTSIRPGTGPGRKLGAIVDEGLADLVFKGALSALVIMADLPALEASDVRALVALLQTHDVVLAPDAAGTGTNALAMRLPAPMNTRFCGGESLVDHLRTASDQGLSIAMCERAGLGFDVDQTADLAKLQTARK
ncbi:MAG: 2-phospho-L-lactate guanylyltransferase [Polyangiaceae bacterium]